MIDAGDIEDRLSGAVVLLQHHDLQLGEVALEVAQVTDVGLAPAVDRLILVADHADVAVAGAEQPHQLVLGDVGVLELVHHQMAVAVLVPGQQVRRATKHLDNVPQEIIEVEAVVLGQQLLVAREDPPDRVLPGAIGLPDVLLDRDKLALGRRDGRKDRARRVPLVVKLQVVHRLPEQAELVGVVQMANRGSSPSTCPSVRSQRAQVAWNVPTLTNRARFGPIRPSRRSRISRAALFVNVTARMCQGSMPSPSIR